MFIQFLLDCSLHAQLTLLPSHETAWNVTWHFSLWNKPKDNNNLPTAGVNAECGLLYNLCNFTVFTLEQSECVIFCLHVCVKQWKAYIERQHLKQAVQGNINRVASCRTLPCSLCFIVSDFSSVFCSLDYFLYNQIHLATAPLHFVLPAAHFYSLSSFYGADSSICLLLRYADKAELLKRNSTIKHTHWKIIRNSNVLFWV